MVQTLLGLRHRRPFWVGSIQTSKIPRSAPNQGRSRGVQMSASDNRVPSKTLTGSRTFATPIPALMVDQPASRPSSLPLQLKIRSATLKPYLRAHSPHSPNSLLPSEPHSSSSVVAMVQTAIKVVQAMNIGMSGRNRGGGLRRKRPASGPH